jgi:FtsP/CotA-like multicopper oxidase with cupredoxin domain
MVMRLINRRQFATGLAIAGFVRPSLAQTQNPQTLTMTKTTSPLLGPESPKTEHWHFKSASGPPILYGKQGQELRFRLLNQLEEDVFVHFFGVRGPSDLMTVQVSAKDTEGVEVVFTPPDAGTFWFGPLTNASKQRELGLSGMLIVEEAEAQSFQDIPLIFDDWSLGDDGKIEQDFANFDRAAGDGRLGNWFTVNSKFKPRITLEAEKPARLRLLNAANTRTTTVLFKAAEGLVIARDGQPIKPERLGLQPLKLAPGQRADVLLTEAQEQVVIALDLFEDIVETAFFDAQGYGRKTLSGDFRLPTNPVPGVDMSKPPGELELVIEGGFKGGLKRARVGTETLDLRAMLERGLAWSIGGSAGLGSPPLFTAKKGEVLKLFFDNQTAFEQPLHVHGHVWTPDTPLPFATQGPQQPLNWSDTLVLPPKGKAQVVMVADNPGTWAIQSLLAERCDAGLIGAFTVSDMP